MLITFGLTVLAWVFFRADNIGHALNYLSGIFSKSIFSMPSFGGGDRALITIVLIMVFLIIEWFGREREFAIANLGLNWKRPYRLAMYYSIILAIFFFMGKQQQFIYFQF